MGRPVGESAPGRHYLVSGRVQGVGFRHFVWSRAQALQVAGWVRNLRDGRVEAAGWGSAEALARFEGELREGPRWSRVDEVAVAPWPDEDPPTGFDVRSTR